MANEKLTSSIEILEDGKLKVVYGGDTVYIQPMIFVDTLDSISRILLKSEPNSEELARVDTTITTIDGVAFSGTFAQLSTAIRIAVKKANGMFLGTVSAGGGGGAVGNVISASNSTTALLGAGATFTGVWENVVDYTSIGISVLGSIATDGVLWIDVRKNGSTIVNSVPFQKINISSNVTNVPAIWNIVESEFRIRYVNGTTAQTGEFYLETKYSNGQQAELLATLDGTISSQQPATIVRPGTSFDLDAARKHIKGQRSFFFFGFNNAVGTSWVDIHPTSGNINWLTTAGTVEVLSSSAVDTNTAGAGVRSVEIHGLSATGEDQDEVILMDGTTPVVSSLTYIRVNKLHSETCGTYGGSHQGDITCRVTGGGAILSKMIGEEGPVDTSVVYGLGEAMNGYWTVPLGKVMYITRLEVIPDVSTGKNVTVHLYERENILTTSAPFTPRRIVWEEDGVETSTTKVFKSHIKIKALTDLWFRAKASANSSIQVALDFYLVDEDSSGA
jgi:hypothetical protein